MDFKYYLIEQINKHPSLMPQDIAKICYQAAMGAEHLLTSLSAARKYFVAELEATEPREGELFERISDEICRVDLGVWKAMGLPGDQLFDMFVGTATVRRGGRETLEEYLLVADDVLKNESVGFTSKEWREFLEKYRSLGMPSVHHSEAYRREERPSYRIVAWELLSGTLDLK